MTAMLRVSFILLQALLIFCSPAIAMSSSKTDQRTGDFEEASSLYTWGLLHFQERPKQALDALYRAILLAPGKAEFSDAFIEHYNKDLSKRLLSVEGDPYHFLLKNQLRRLEPIALSRKNAFHLRRRLAEFHSDLNNFEKAGKLLLINYQSRPENAEDNRLLLKHYSDIKENKKALLLAEKTRAEIAFNKHYELQLTAARF